MFFCPKSNNPVVLGRTMSQCYFRLTHLVALGINSTTRAVERGVEHWLKRLDTSDQLPFQFFSVANDFQKTLHNTSFELVITDPNPHWPGFGLVGSGFPELVVFQIGTYGFWKWFQHCRDVESLCREQNRKFVQPLPSILSTQWVNIAFWRGELASCCGSSSVRIDRKVEHCVGMVPAHAMLIARSIVRTVEQKNPVG